MRDTTRVEVSGLWEFPSSTKPHFNFPHKLTVTPDNTNIDGSPVYISETIKKMYGGMNKFSSFYFAPREEIDYDTTREKRETTRQEAKT